MRISPRALDIVFAAVSAVLTTLVLLDTGIAAASDQSIAGSRWWVAPLILVPSVALLFRRTSPLATIAGVWIPVALQAQLTGDGGEGLYLVWPAWVSLYALAAYGTRRQLFTGIPLALVCLAVHDLNDPLNWRTAEGAWAAAWWDLVLFVPALVGGVVAASRRTRTLATEKALVEAQARAAVAEERARIARELHDVVTHHVNLVVLQAMAASGLLDRDPGAGPGAAAGRSSAAAGRRSPRCAGCSGCCATTTPSARSPRSPAWTSCRRPRRIAPARRSLGRSWPSRGTPRPLPTGPRAHRRTGSCRRR